MPIELETTIARDPVTKSEIVQFTVDLRGFLLRTELADLTDAGEVVRRHIPEPVRLLDADGRPRFTAEEYASIKGAIYRMLIEDGIVSGTVL